MKARLGAYLWSVVSIVATLALALVVANWNRPALSQAVGTPQQEHLSFLLIYFFAAVAVIALVLFFIPLRWLKYFFRIIYALMLAWGVFIVTYFKLPTWVAYVLAAAGGLAWLFFARIWLHDILLLIALAAAGSIFGYLFSPWTFMIFMLVIAVYDFLAVRFGFMVWMADRLTGAASLPAFVFPKKAADANLNLRVVQFDALKKEESSRREHTILGGGDIGFPVMLACSVYFVPKYGLPGAVVVGAFATVGLIGAFVIQATLYKGKPVPALPPIAALSLIGWLIVFFFMK